MEIMPVDQATLLVVDDNPSNRNILMRHLQRQGHKVLEAEDGQQCLDILDTQDCDLVMLDIMMPVMDGIIALQEIRKTYSLVQLPVIMVTALNDFDYTVNALKSGANDYITKPFDFDVVLARVHTHLILKQLSEQNQEFLSIASHDIKKPIAVIMDIAEVMRGELSKLDSNTADIEDMLSLLTRSAKTIQKHIEDYLDLSIVEHGQIKLKRHKLQLNHLIRDCLSQNYEYARNKGIELEEALDEVLPDIFVDPDRIMQVVDNMVGNAIKYSPTKTTTRVRTFSRNGSVVFEVSDEGPGINGTDINNLFQKHKRTQNLPTGGEVSTGLGLSICKQLMTLHEGQIGVRNNDEKGATFWIELPVRP